MKILLLICTYSMIALPPDTRTAINNERVMHEAAHHHNAHTAAAINTNAALSLAQHIRAAFGLTIHVPDPHSSFIVRHWHMWIKEVLLAILLTGVLALINNCFTALFKAVGLFATSACSINNLFFLSSNATYFDQNATHFFYSVPKT